MIIAIDLIKKIRHLQTLLLRSQIFRVRSWLPDTTLFGSPINFAAKTFALWPVSVCCKYSVR